ncbi:uncharacterized protein BJ212DRAFT_1322159 [Suillus subaureus]|uniref:Uncharacterized protein n=1 Tax=Suillus subaureus TaxID=48587 RepID=A0A9P7JIL9_9AGAM|nr:uncharacterized protein BJ212DRAFT_1322159 [Suillus subaureus]KAG1824741.1 hypothetical protein BJ212DRAFT_1322159 [Suillus subaureus]
MTRNVRFKFVVWSLIIFVKATSPPGLPHCTTEWYPMEGLAPFCPSNNVDTRLRYNFVKKVFLSFSDTSTNPCLWHRCMLEATRMPREVEAVPLSPTPIDKTLAHDMIEYPKSIYSVALVFPSSAIPTINISRLADKGLLFYHSFFSASSGLYHNGF